MSNFKHGFKKFLFSILALICFQAVFAQYYPAFSVTAYTPASKGYYFIVPIKFAAASNPTHMILDSLGRVVYYKEFASVSASDFKILQNGLMCYASNSKYYLMDSSFTIVDSVRCQNGIGTDTHDMQILPNGNFLMLGFEYVVMDLSAYNYFGPNNNLPGSTTANVRSVVVQELDAAHNVVFEWHAADHFAFADVDPRFLQGPFNVDWTHTNSVEMDTDGNILISSRHFNEVTKISRTDSSVIWRMGGNANQFTFINDTFPFVGQHDARRIANGNFTVNDNGHANSPDHYAAAKEYILDETLLNATLVWDYVEDTASYSVALGNVQRLANGNTVVDYGNTPNKSLMFNVVDPAGNKVFEVTFADTLRTYRAFNYPTLPWSFVRPQVGCYMIGQQLFLDAGNYSSYRWSTGDTTQIIPVSAADTFSVFVPNGQGGFISSDFLVINNPAIYCGNIGIETISEAAFEIYPNPVTDELIIKSSFDQSDVSIRIYDAVGKCVFANEVQHPNQQINIQVANLSAGIYYVLVNGSGKKFVKQ